ncbi:MAG: hypothetical protein CMQ15_10340 [Gammaproteobacteria bacterium]|nr:hypothetical protein [Gammaproteobacteria bacterium]
MLGAIHRSFRADILYRRQVSPLAGRRVCRFTAYGYLTWHRTSERIDLNDQDQEIAREWLLEEFKQRIRDVRQGPDGYLYVLTEAEDAALLKISPVEEQ